MKEAKKHPGWRHGERALLSSGTLTKARWRWGTVTPRHKCGRGCSRKAAPGGQY